jgi:inhibitor of KinA
MEPFVPLGDQAVLARLPDEAAALGFAAAVRRAALPWLVDLVPAYSSVAIFFDADQMNYAAASQILCRLLHDVDQAPPASESRLRQIPCCYALGPDLARVAKHVGKEPEEVIRLHSGTEYIVYAIGFCPGFPYLGYLPPELCGVPRLATPRLRVEPGSVGLTGRQTGIYPQARPGGWNLIGRTPLELVHVADGYFPLRTGDRVRFEPIDEAEFRRLLGRRL